MAIEKKANQDVLNRVVKWAQYQDALPEHRDSIWFKTPAGLMSPIGQILTDEGEYDSKLEVYNYDDPEIKDALEKLGYDHDFLLRVDRIVCSSEIMESWMDELKELAGEMGLEVEEN